MAADDTQLARWLQQLGAVVVRTELGLTAGLLPQQLVCFAELETKLREVTADAELRRLYLETLRRVIALRKTTLP